MKPAKLSGHHIDILKNYKLNGKIPSSHDSYGEKFVKNEKNVFDRILNGETSIIMVDGFDDVCSICNYMTKEGCLKPDKFIPLERVITENRIFAEEYALRMCVEYTKQEFLGKIDKEISDSERLSVKEKYPDYFRKIRDENSHILKEIEEKYQKTKNNFQKTISARIAMLHRQACR